MKQKIRKIYFPRTETNSTLYVVCILYHSRTYKCIISYITYKSMYNIVKSIWTVIARVYLLVLYYGSPSAAAQQYNNIIRAQHITSQYSTVQDVPNKTYIFIYVNQQQKNIPFHFISNLCNFCYCSGRDAKYLSVTVFYQHYSAYIIISYIYYRNRNNLLGGHRRQNMRDR